MEKKAVSGIMLTLLLTVLFLGALMIGDVRAHASGVSLSAWTPTLANIDGTIDPAEWASADVISFTTSDGLLPGRTGTLYVMNDATNLYLAVAMPDTTPDINDQCYFYFDNDHDGIFEKGDDSVGISGVRPVTVSPEYRDLHWNPDVPGWTEDWYPAYGIYGTIDGSGDASNMAGINYFEFSHPLDSGDDDYDFSLAQGDTVGFAVGYYDDGSSVGWFPGISGNPGDYGDIDIASPPNPIEALEELIESIEKWNLSKGTENSLISKLKGVLHLLDKGNENGTIHKLIGFINQVEALREKKLADDKADYLVSEAQRIIDFIKE